MLVQVRVQPRARRASLGGLRHGPDGPRLMISVTTPPEDGRATAAACAALATALGLPPSRVTLAQGPTSREKTLRVTAPPEALRPRLETLA
ncbi:DUF167 domain-containing protein [Roseococcus suduntuyensis]|uniref:UPF0235 protein GGQ83_003442 n=1 Tax=Roseococcus suduntuyensis TaxID=455361 RepID=A0A840AIU3_9PROT|nr:DUF167 domain-containing protein [Roseococcus suduntuyensis]MBB3899975.1 hypothetical protein [Roseococcus suduntuyensis]